MWLFQRGARIRLLCAAALVLVACGVVRCLDPKNPLVASAGPGVPIGTAHSISLGGVRHADGYCQPYLNCTTCHGDSLLGGAHGEPSCTKCHVAFWNSPNCGMVSHTVNLGGHLHAPGYCTPLVNCTTCHGAQLQGGRNGEPSCTACHGNLWTGSDCGGG